MSYFVPNHTLSVLESSAVMGMIGKNENTNKVSVSSSEGFHIYSFLKISAGKYVSNIEGA